MEREAAPSGGASQGHSCFYRETALSEGASEGRIKMIDLHAYQGCYPAPCKFQGLVFQMRVALRMPPLRCAGDGIIPYLEVVWHP